MIRNKSVENTVSKCIQLLKWLVISLVFGVVIGCISSGFLYCIAKVTDFRTSHHNILLLLPFAGLFIVFLYRISNQKNDSGTNLVLSAIRSENDIPPQMIPLILIATLITHLFGGSAGREGAALQFGGSFGNITAKKLHFNDSDKKILIMAGMSAAFAGIFGTPLAAAIFSLEVVSVGIIYYAALVPCVFSSFIAYGVSVYFKLHLIRTPYPIVNAPSFYSLHAFKAVILAILCSIVGAIFCYVLHKTDKLYSKFIPNQYIRVFVGGLLVVILSYSLQTTKYLGIGDVIIKQSFANSASIQDFALKIIFTCLTLCAGFKGGEIVPAFFIGATFGSAFAPIIGLPVGLCAACGMVGVFCAVTNSPITSILIAFELFGAQGIPYFSIVIAISYLISGYSGLYSSQKIIYSKTEMKYINHHTNHVSKRGGHNLKNIKSWKRYLKLKVTPKK